MAETECEYEEELNRQLREAFDEVDIDKNGVISQEEIKIAFKKMGYQVTDKAVEVRSLNN